MTVFTIGYEGINIDAFMHLLTEYDIETIVDIRELPLSRKPGFSKKSLANILNLSGREYVHIAELGCPKLVRDQYRIDRDWAAYTKGFKKYLNTQHAAIENLSNLAISSNCALLCFEADYNFCHRKFVANAVSDYSSADVMHIEVSAKKAQLALY